MDGDFTRVILRVVATPEHGAIAHVFQAETHKDALHPKSLSLYLATTVENRNY